MAPLSPPARPGGRQREVEIRPVLDGIFDVLETGCPWRPLPKDLPPRSTCHAYFQLWRWEGTVERLHHHFYQHRREQAGREASPTAAIVDRQSIRSAPKGGTFRDPVGYDGGTNVKGVTYHSVVDTLGLWLNVAVHPADRQDRDGADRDGAAAVLNKKTRSLFPFIKVVFADGGSQGPVAAEQVRQTGTWTLEIVQRPIRPKALSSFPSDGVSRGRCRGSHAAGAWYAMTSHTCRPRLRSFAWR